MTLRFAILLACLVLGWTGGAFAQQAVVRSGEHPGFSRLALPVEASILWTLEDTPRGKILRFDDPNLALDISEVFDFIPKNRISAVTYEGGVLRLELGCDCPVNLFRHNAAFLILDVRDGVPWEDDVAAPESGPDVSAFAPPLARDGRTRHALMLLEGLVVSAPPSAEPPEPSAEAPAFQESLSEGLRVGLAQGVLSPLPTLPAQEPPSAAAIIGDPSPVPVSPVPTPSNAPEPVEQLAIQTSLGSIIHDGETPAHHCDMPFSLRRQNWPEAWAGADYLRAAGDLQATSNRSDITTAQAEASALLLMAIGFGAEARALLNVDLEANAALVEVSRIIDGEIIGAESLFADHYTCASQAAIWAIAAQGAIPIDAVLEEAAVLSEFMELPMAVREILKPTVLRRLDQAGFTALAARITAFSGTEASAPVFSIRAAEAGETDQALPNAAAAKPEIQGATAHEVLLERFSVQRSQSAASDLADIDHGFALLNSVSLQSQRQQLAVELVIAALLSEQVPRGLALLSDPTLGPDLDIALHNEIAQIALRSLRPAEAALVAMALRVGPAHAGTPSQELMARLSQAGLAELVAPGVEMPVQVASIPASPTQAGVPSVQASEPRLLSGDDIRDAEQALQTSQRLRAEIGTLLTAPADR